MATVIWTLAFAGVAATTTGASAQATVMAPAVTPAIPAPARPMWGGGGDGGMFLIDDDDDDDDGGFFLFEDDDDGGGDFGGF
jgi:hypothetical protein